MDYEALYKLTHGLYVLGAKDGDKFAGSIVDAVMQVANKPWIIAISCTNTSYTKQCVIKNKEFSLSVLSKKVNPFVIANFGFQSSKNVNKWEKVDYCVVEGLPYLKDNLATLHCKVLQEVVFESNTMFVAEVMNCADNQDDEALTYSDYRTYLKKDVLKSFEEMKKGGKPTMTDNNVKETKVETTSGNETNSEKHWVCTVCDYVYDEAVPFEELPDDWACPICGVDKSMFILK